MCEIKPRGFSLIEVLITMLILGIGLMGLATMQFISLKNLNSSHFRYQAALIAYDMAERMRANRSAVTAGTYNNMAVDGTESQVTCSPCSSAQIADWDAYEWGQAIVTEAKLPEGTGTIAGDGSSFTIVMNWKEQQTGGGFGTVGADVEDKSYTLTLQL
jgi:type IV pilus assembly protein PilV